MDNHIITNLQKFEKPDADFLKEKECLICLEPFDLELNNIVKLPCKCSNSAYHIDCIVKLLTSGKNKNFCPHCKTKYEICLKAKISRNQVVPYTAINTNQQNTYEIQIPIFTKIITFHVFSNSMMNLINIILSRIFADYDSFPELQALMLLYFGKLFFNFHSYIYSKNSIQKIKDCVVYSYICQLVLFGFLIYILTKIKNDDKKVNLIVVNNVIFGFVDFTYRKIKENKLENTVNVI